ncbi:MAG: S16 family serine protease [Candidatus Woesearchaeota archaeon]|jgi:uncharacterized protein
MSKLEIVRCKLTILLIILFSFAIIPFVNAQNNHIQLLAVSEDGIIQIGQVVDLYIEVIPGSGRVFIDSYPLTKMDTQVSTRFANKFACDYANIDCSKIDFIYTIRSNSPIIGGPSASAAIGALTIAKLTNSNIDEKVALTGTLNSGGIIGIVGGVDKKILAAKEKGLTKVLIPKGSKIEEEITKHSGIENITDIELNNSKEENITKEIQINLQNKFINWTEFGKENKITVIEVITMQEVLKEFGVKYEKKKEDEKKIDDYYQKTMMALATDLCDKADTLSKEIKKILKNETQTKDANELKERGELFFSQEKYYSSASQCFASLSRYRFYELKQKNMSNETINDLTLNTKEDIDNYIIPKYTTIMDLQAYAVVKERLIDAKKSIDESKTKNGDDRLSTLAYAIERFNTANSWSTFITHHGTAVNLDETSLKNACIDRMQEAEELKQYVDLYIPVGLFKTASESLETANNEYISKEYELCIFSASKSKAESNMILNTLGIEENQIKELVDSKLNIILQVINSNKNSFPIVGYSYYEYAKTLNDINDSSSALLYEEYALELSTMNLYFNGDISRNKFENFDNKITTSGKWDTLYTFILGFVLGILTILFHNNKKKENKFSNEDIKIKIRKRK